MTTKKKNTAKKVDMLVFRVFQKIVELITVGSSLTFCRLL